MLLCEGEQPRDDFIARIEADGESLPDTATRFRILCEVRIVQLAAVFGIPQKDDLLPTNLSERVVLDNDDEDRQVVFDGCQELAHQHREAAVADEGDGLPVRISDLGG